MRIALRRLLLTSKARARVRLLACVLAGLLAGGLPARAAWAATPADLADLEAQADYAFYTEDARALRELLRADRGLPDAGEPRRLYEYAFAQFRALQLATFSRKARDAESFGDACVDALDRVLDKEPRAVEALTLQAACLGYVAAAGGLRALSARPRCAARLEAAQALAPSNPRVLLVAALLGYLPADARESQRGSAIAQLERAARLFDTVAATEPGAPGWGAADTWLLAGRAHEERGELLLARNAYEKALLIAPDFARARRRLATLTRRR